ncbi:non-histone chromosomal MC1 family protein [Salarchaeum sp. JOR-1]|uniref:non-histone chromosomal MC1 family protein n=1 Tax=Salarchaeum sp. JOR-1 TaxID=2599399 RepID=UPI00119850C6|nr:non-histone chromosomal MC1 family protein [Salarchaeum sp. JOR-1]QDX40078.1 chromosomal protein MC1 [Salarchaeum sp. JOR-1]
MAREDGKRNFALRDVDGTETSVFSGNTPRQAALKAARRLEDVADGEQNAKRHDIRLREKGSDKVHIYEAWAWEEDAPDDSPDWMPSRITKANVSKQGIEHVDDI